MICLISLRLIQIGCLVYRIGELLKRMYYYLNDYSLRGQFTKEEDFYRSLRENTLPALKRIEENKENMIWKSQNLWSCEVCKGVTLQSFTPKKNERNLELTKLKQKLIKLYRAEPFWSKEEAKQICCCYQFDTEYCKNFDIINCFTLAIENDGRIFSFEHEEYTRDQLPLAIQGEKYELANVWNVKFWQRQPKVRTWFIEDRYRVEVRANEFDYHPPHFHVSYNEFAMVFRLKDGGLYRPKKEEIPGAMYKSICEWYVEHREELQEAWECLHGGLDT